VSSPGERSSFPLSSIAGSMSVAAVVLGMLWDVSWDATIGRDSFWSPPHLMTYLGAVVAGLIGVVLVLRSAVRPIGAWVLIWGGVAVQAAALFDAWWQTAYGFHVGAWMSPPQALHTAGVLGLHAGVLLLIAGWQNRTGRASPFFALTGGMLLAFLVSLNTELAWPNLHHTGLFYQVSCAMIPIALVALARSSPNGYGATFAALIYMITICALIWLFPLVPAKPLIGPIYHAVDHLLPPIFPLLLAIPALAIDRLARRRSWSGWIGSLACGLIFAVLFFAIQWPFASFLLSPSADNWFFAGGGKNWPFYFQVGGGATTFWGQTKIPMTAGAAVSSALFAMISARVGWWWGDWMGAVRR
jgi:hypothetical protein